MNQFILGCNKKRLAESASRFCILRSEWIYLPTPTAAVEPASANAASEAATTDRSAGHPAAVSITAAVATAIAVSTTITVSGATVPSAAVSAATIPAATVKAVIPGAGSDEYTTRKPAGAVVSVRRASIRIVTVVAVCTGRRDSDVSWAYAYSNPYRNPGMGKSGRQYKNTE